MKPKETLGTDLSRDRLEGDKIILDGKGKFPKRVIILEPGKTREYKIIKTAKGGYLLN